MSSAENSYLKSLNQQQSLWYEEEGCEMKQAHVRRRIVESFLIVWFDRNGDESSHDYQYLISQFRQIISSIKMFAFVDDCVDYLNELKNEKVLLVVSDSLGQELVPIIQDIPSLYAIYVLCSDPTTMELSITDYSKVKSTFTKIESLCARLTQDLHQIDRNLMSISIIPPDLPSDLNKLDQSFMYSQLLKEILLKMTNDDKTKKDFILSCREQCSENDPRLSVIDEFERKYDPTSAIRWYTRDCFIYPMLNKALRAQEIDNIINMSFFIRDLHRQIEELCSSASHDHPLVLYRGQGMNNIEFQKLLKSKGGLLSFNNFLSTTSDEQVGLMYADSVQQDPELTGILFQIHINPQTISTPFASVREVSYFQNTEEEILFSMHTIFRIDEISPIDNCLWKVNLISTTNHDKDLKHLTDFLRREFSDEIESMQLVDLMIFMGEYNKAEEIYRATHNVNDIDNASIQHQMGFLMNKKGKNKLALSFYERALEIQENSPLTDQLDIASTHKRIGDIRLSMGEYSIALNCFNKALAIEKELLPENDITLARTYNHISVPYWFTGEYPKSLDYAKKAFNIFQQLLPQYHPQLAMQHNNIAAVQQALGDYSNALINYKKTLEIEQRILPPNHPDLTIINNNIGELYRRLGQWSNALEHYQTTLKIQEESSIPNHPTRAIFHNNSAEVYRLKGNGYL